jgi:hypothetical protein
MSIARCAGLAFAAVLALSIWAPSVAHAGGCTNEWKSAVSGMWTTAANWSANKVPGSEEEACITKEGTYTVAIEASSASVKSLTLGGSSGTQTLVEESSSSGAATLSTSEGLGIGAHGALTLTNAGVSANTDVLSGPVTNAGTISILAGGAGGERRLESNLTNTNTGTVSVQSATNFNASKTFTNEGAVDLGESAQLSLSGGSTFVDAAGSLAATGSGDVYVSGTAKYVQGGGTTSGSQPVIVEAGTIEYTGSGASTIRARSYYSYISGNIAKGQTLVVEGCVGGTVAGILVASKSFENAGTIELSSGDYKGSGCGGGDESRLKLESGVTLTNTSTGKILVEPGIGGERKVEGPGAITNKGVVDINATTVENTGSASFTNEGEVNLATGTQFGFQSSSTFTNAGGSLNASGNASVVLGGSATFNQGAGSTNGTEPVIAEASHINYTGSGASVIHENSYYGYISGNIAKGQTLVVEGCAGGTDQGIVVASKSFENAGTIELTSADYKGSACGVGGDESRLKVEAGVTVTNTSTGKILVEPGIGGERKFEGSITNKGVVDINATTVDNTGSATFINEGEVKLAASTQFSFQSSTTFTNGTGA